MNRWMDGKEGQKEGKRSERLKSLYYLARFLNSEIFTSYVIRSIIYMMLTGLHFVLLSKGYLF